MDIFLEPSGASPERRGRRRRRPRETRNISLQATTRKRRRARVEGRKLDAARAPHVYKKAKEGREQRTVNR
ncbi:MAG TPA: hypothetical protein VF586_05890, partial [Pyrinomonadaceae bacterium]